MSKQNQADVLKKNLIGTIKTLKLKSLDIAAAVKLLFVTTIPVWIVSRPAAFKQWRNTDRKKKKYRSFRLQKKLRPEPRYIPPAYKLLHQSLLFIYRYKRVFIPLIIYHAILYFTFLRTNPTLDVASLQESIQTVLGPDASSAKNTAALLGTVLATPNDGAAKPQAVFIVMLASGLPLIWATRQLTAGKIIKARDAIYRGFEPLIPTIMLLILISFQLVPFALASFVYATARSGGIFISGYEDLSFFIVTLLIGILCLYFITTSVIAIMIATLSGMYPKKALRAAKKLVEFRRLVVFKRVFSVPILLLILGLIVLLITIRTIPSIAYQVIDVMIILATPIICVYLYKLYRALI